MFYALYSLQQGLLFEMTISSGRIHNVDFARGLACLSMPFFHTVYNLHTAGLTDRLWTKNLFWETYQTIGLSTFILVSGMAFVLSTQQGVRWDRLGKRALKLGSIAMLISLATYLVLPNKFVRFGVLHFFTVAILVAPLFKPLKQWAILPGLVIVAVGVHLDRKGIAPEPWLYITGLMSNRPSSIDYIPLIPWFGLFLVGLGSACWLRTPRQSKPPARWKSPIIWLGKRSLWFYLIHQAVIFGVLKGIALLIK